MECGICFELILQNKQLSCNHELCIECYYKLYKNTCPFCRSIFIYSLDDIKQREQYHKQIFNNNYEATYDTELDTFNTFDIFDTELDIFDTELDTFDTELDTFDTELDAFKYNFIEFIIEITYIYFILFYILIIAFYIFF
jgi:hypothetical protein